VDHERCTRCRNPIRARQASVAHARVQVSFHLDCWDAVHEEAQRAYVRRCAEQGLEALLSPYSRVGSTTWLTDPLGDPAAEGDDPAPEQKLAG
jgi:hypothetical protein